MPLVFFFLEPVVSVANRHVPQKPVSRLISKHLKYPWIHIERELLLSPEIASG